MAFELEEAACQLHHKNDRIEKHGEEDRLACDLNFSFDTDNGILAMFAPSLRHALYGQRDDGQGSLVDATDHLTALRFPALAHLRWDAGQHVGASLRFHYGPTGKGDVEFAETKVGKYKLECKEGGTVVVHFQAQVYPDDKQCAFLSKILRDKICTISVKAPGGE